MRRLLIILTLTVAVLLVGTAGYLLLADLSHLKRPLLDLLSERMDRRLNVEGKFELDIGRQLRVTATQVTLANAEWSTRGNLLSSAYLGVKIDTLSLLPGRRLIIDALEANGVELALEEGADDQRNWRFGDDSSQTELPIFRRVALRDVELLFDAPPRDTPLQMHIDSAELDEGATGLIELTSRGSAEGRAFIVSGQAGPLSAFVSGRNIGMSLAGSVGDMQFMVEGEVGQADTLEGISAELSITGPDASVIAELLGEPGALEDAFDLRAKISDALPGIAFEIVGDFVALDLHLQGRVADPLNFDGLNVDVDLEGKELAQLGRFVGRNDWPDVAYTLDGKVSRTGSQLDIDDARLNVADASLTVDAHLMQFPDPAGATVRVKLRGTNLARFSLPLGLPGVVAAPFSLDAELQNNGKGYDVLSARLEVGKHRLDAKGNVQGYPDFAGTELVLDLSGEQLEEITDSFSVPRIGAGPYSLTGTVRRTPSGFELTRMSLDAGTLQLSIHGGIGVAGKSVQLEKLTSTFGDVAFTLDGHLGEAPDFIGAQLRLTAEGPDLSVLAPDPVELHPVPFDASGRIERAREHVVLRNVVIRSGATSVHLDGRVGTNTGLVGTALDVVAEGPDLNEIWVPPDAYEVPQAPFAITGRVGISSATGFEFRNMKVSLGEARLTADGDSVLENGARVTELEVVASGPALSALGTWGDYTLPPLPFDVRADIRQTATGVWIRNARVTWGESTFDASGVYQPGADVQVDLDINATYIDVQPFLANRETAPEPSPNRDRKRLIPDTPISLDWLPDLYWRLNLRADELRAFAVPLRNVVVDLDVGPDRLWLTPLQFEQQLGDLSGELKLDRLGSRVQVAADLVARKVPLSFLAAPDQDPATLPLATVELKAIGSGESGRALARDLKGRLRFIASEGQIANAAAQAMFGDFFMDLLGALNPVSRRPTYAELVCGVVLIDIADGRIKTRPGIAIQTDRLNILARGTVNLETERLDINFETGPRRGVGIGAGDLINPFIRVGGTLADPRLRINRTGAAITGGAALATGGLSLLFQTASRRIRRSDDPCGALLEAEARAAGGQK